MDGITLVAIETGIGVITLLITILRIYVNLIRILQRHEDCIKFLDKRVKRLEDILNSKYVYRRRYDGNV